MIIWLVIAEAALLATSLSIDAFAASFTGIPLMSPRVCRISTPPGIIRSGSGFMAVERISSVMGHRKINKILLIFSGILI